MTPRRFALLDLATAVATIALLALALWIALRGPTTPIPVHFDISGQADRWGGRGEVAGLFAFMALVTGGSAGGLGWFAARGETAARRRGLRLGQGVALIALTGLSLLMATQMLGAASATSPNPAPSNPAWIMAGLGALLAMIGAGMGRIAPNPLIGVRTPWAFKSRLAWDRSNRLAGRLFFGLGLIAVAAAPFAPQPAGFTALIIAVLAAALASVVESWRVWRADPDRQPF